MGTEKQLTILKQVQLDEKKIKRYDNETKRLGYFSRQGWRSSEEMTKFIAALKKIDIKFDPKELRALRTKKFPTKKTVKKKESQPSNTKETVSIADKIKHLVNEVMQEVGDIKLESPEILIKRLTPIVAKYEIELQRITEENEEMSGSSLKEFIKDEKKLKSMRIVLLLVKKEKIVSKIKEFVFNRKGNSLDGILSLLEDQGLELQKLILEYEDILSSKESWALGELFCTAKGAISILKSRQVKETCLEQAWREIKDFFR